MYQKSTEQSNEKPSELQMVQNQKNSIINQLKNGKDFNMTSSFDLLPKKINVRNRMNLTMNKL